MGLSLAFVRIGLELSTSAFNKTGWWPPLVHLIATIFNRLLAMGV